MQSFAFATAAHPTEAIKAAAAPATFIAGGTELLNWMRLGIVEPARVLDVGGLDALRGIARDGDQLVVGALSTLNEVGEHPLLAQHAAGLAQACLKAASAQIRNRATLGGNVLQKTRCAYFRAEAPLPWPCNKRAPGSGCAARQGISDRHAILGHTEACVATQPSDPAVALACLDAAIDVLGPDGPRRLAVAEFHVTPEDALAEAASGRRQALALGGEAQVETRLGPDELILAYRIPIREGERSAYVKVRERESYEYALVSAAAAVRLDGGRVAAARIALGSVALKPWRLAAAEQALVGAPFEKGALREAVAAALGEARPLKDNAYKVPLAANAAVRALEIAGGRA